MSQVETNHCNSMAILKIERWVGSLMEWDIFLPDPLSSYRRLVGGQGLMEAFPLSLPSHLRISIREWRSERKEMAKPLSSQCGIWGLTCLSWVKGMILFRMSITPLFLSPRNTEYLRSRPRGRDMKGSVLHMAGRTPGKWSMEPRTKICGPYPGG